MLMTFPVVVQSVKLAKDEKHQNYGSFLFTGGSLSVPIDAGQLGLLQNNQGAEIEAVFEMRPITIIRFNRPVSVFEPVRFISTATKKKKTEDFA